MAMFLRRRELNMRAHIAAGLVALSTFTFTAPASADEPARAADAPSAGSASWRSRFAEARAALLDRRYRSAQASFFALALDAPDEGSRVLALEMMQVAAEYANRDERIPATEVVGPPLRVRGNDEMTLLYMSSLLYGIGSGVWLLLETQPDSAVTATLPFAAATAAPVIAVATVDGYRKLARGVPHAISAGLYLGLGEGVLLTAMQNARASHSSADAAWKPETVAGVLWGGATLGGVVGGALGSSLVTTPGRVSFTASTTLWSGVVTGLAAASLLPEDDKRRERSFGVASIGYELGLVSGLLLAGPVSPSVTRVRLVDLTGAATALAGTGLYLSFVGDPDRRTAEGIAATGAVVGLTAGWWLTRSMKADLPEQPATGFFAVQPSIEPVAGGALLGVRGAL